MEAAPAVSGQWGLPLAGGYSKGRGFGYHPVAGCSYCSTNHQGYDMAQGCGATIYAAGPGEVITGQQVTAGTAVGAEGNTGKSFGCHLHFEVRKSGSSVDPEPFMAALGLSLK